MFTGKNVRSQVIGTDSFKTRLSHANKNSMEEEKGFQEASRQIRSTMVLLINLILYAYKPKSNFEIKGN